MYVTLPPGVGDAGNRSVSRSDDDKEIVCRQVKTTPRWIY